MTSVYDFAALDIDGRERSLREHEGKVLLVVNVASKCGFTPQYKGLEALWRRYRDAGLVVLGFPCDQFARQEPGSETEIKTFCSLEYDVTFPLFSKVDVNGPNAHPLFRWLKDARPGVLGTRAIKWNFTKFLVGRDGGVAGRYAPAVRPERIEDDLKAILL